eukprot:augustus_masked-scaffold_3-processed-gene-1.50-mRNA-1 protein AED:1.00 eAED:1.00 QI:0/-1/0/0/-1/1/1/0/921
MIMEKTELDSEELLQALEKPYRDLGHDILYVFKVVSYEKPGKHPSKSKNSPRAVVITMFGEEREVILHKVILSNKLKVKKSFYYNLGDLNTLEKVSNDLFTNSNEEDTLQQGRLCFLDSETKQETELMLYFHEDAELRKLFQTIIKVCLEFTQIVPKIRNFGSEDIIPPVEDEVDVVMNVPLKSKHREHLKINVKLKQISERLGRTVGDFELQKVVQEEADEELKMSKRLDQDVDLQKIIKSLSSLENEIDEFEKYLFNLDSYVVEGEKSWNKIHLANDEGRKKKDAAQDLFENLQEQVLSVSLAENEIKTLNELNFILQRIIVNKSSEDLDAVVHLCERLRQIAQNEKSVTYLGDILSGVREEFENVKAMSLKVFTNIYFSLVEVVTKQSADCLVKFQEQRLNTDPFDLITHLVKGFRAELSFVRPLFYGLQSLSEQYSTEFTNIYANEVGMFYSQAFKLIIKEHFRSIDATQQESFNLKFMNLSAIGNSTNELYVNEVFVKQIASQHETGSGFYSLMQKMLAVIKDETEYSKEFFSHLDDFTVKNMSHSGQKLEFSEFDAFLYKMFLEREDLVYLLSEHGGENMSQYDHVLSYVKCTRLLALQGMNSNTGFDRFFIDAVREVSKKQIDAIFDTEQLYLDSVKPRAKYSGVTSVVRKLPNFLERFLLLCSGTAVDYIEEQLENYMKTVFIWLDQTATQISMNMLRTKSYHKYKAIFLLENHNFFYQTLKPRQDKFQCIFLDEILEESNMRMNKLIDGYCNIYIHRDRNLQPVLDFLGLEEFNNMDNLKDVAFVKSIVLLRDTYNHIDLQGLNRAKRRKNIKCLPHKFPKASSYDFNFTLRRISQKINKHFTADSKIKGIVLERLVINITQKYEKLFIIAGDGYQEKLPYSADEFQKKLLQLLTRSEPEPITEDVEMKSEY